MRVYQGPDVNVAGDASRELGKTIIRDHTTTGQAGTVDRGGKLQAGQPGCLQDYFLRDVYKHCLYRDDFSEASERWYKSVGTMAHANTGASIASDQHMRLTTAGGGAGNAADMQMSFPASAECRIGLLIYWARFSATDARDRYTYFYLRRGDPVADKQIAIRYANYVGGVQTRQWQIFNAGAAWVNLMAETIINNNVRNYWNRLWIVADFTAATYAELDEIDTNFVTATKPTYPAQMGDPAFSALDTWDMQILMDEDTAGAAIVNIGYVGVFQLD